MTEAEQPSLYQQFREYYLGGQWTKEANRAWLERWGAAAQETDVLLWGVVVMTIGQMGRMISIEEELAALRSARFRTSSE